MTPKQRTSAIARIKAHFDEQLTPEIKTLIAQANHDLYSGPHTDDGYPGFERACTMISNALDVGDTWVDLEGDWVGDTEPEWEDPSDPESSGFMPEDFCLFERSDVKRAIVGTELAVYV